ncbi:hypothetical protein AX14_006085, partial [Amanita brunnescens Koide BX004]
SPLGILGIHWESTGKGGSVISTGNWQCVDKRAVQPESQVAIYVNTRFTSTYQLFPIFDSTIDPGVLALCIRHNAVPSLFFHIINVYNRPGTHHSAVESLLRLVPTLTNIAVIQGDFNLHSPLWDPAFSNASGLGERLFYSLSDLELNLANDDGDATWTNRHGARSVIDLLFYSDILARVSPQTIVDLASRGRSDHAIIFLAFGKQSPHWGRPYIARDSEEEAAYLQDLANAIITNCHLDPDVAGDNILTLANIAWTAHSKTPRTDSNPNSWWTDDCQLAKDKYILDRSRANLALYNAATKAARQDFFMHRIELMTENNAPWEGLRWTKPRPPPKYSTILHNGQPIPSMPDQTHRFFVSYHHHPPSLSTLSPSPAFSDPSLSSDSWTTMRRKSPSSSTKSSSRAPPPSKILSPLASPSLSSLPKAPLLPPALSASPSGARASPPPPENLWDDYPDSHWEVDNDIYCDSMGCSYDAHKNPRLATVAATVIEFDDCSYQEYEDTLFLCKICNISCRRSVNKSKIKSKMPLEDFLRLQRSEDDSFSTEAIGLSLPPPSAADFPPLAPCPAPKCLAPKLTKAEKITQGKISALLASTPLPAKPDAKHRKASSPPDTAGTPESPAQKFLEHSDQSGRPQAATSLAPSPVPNVLLSASPDRAPSPVTPILAVAALQVAHSSACSHDPNTCAICRVGITCCKCQIMYTAPGTKRMRCSACLHWACDLDDNEACCSCGVLWVPKPHPAALPSLRDPDHSLERALPHRTSDALSMGTLQPATRLYGGAPSIGSTEDDDNESDSSASATGDDTVRPAAPPTPPPFPASSADEIDAFASIRYDESRPTSVTAIREGDTSSHYGFENKAIEDLTWSSTPEPAEAIPGYKHSNWPDTILQCEDGDAYHFIKRGEADISKIADELDALMSGDT